MSFGGESLKRDGKGGNVQQEKEERKIVGGKLKLKKKIKIKV
jgi:hypothetical protein